MIPGSASAPHCISLSGNGEMSDRISTGNLSPHNSQNLVDADTGLLQLGQKDNLRSTCWEIIDVFDLYLFFYKKKEERFKKKPNK